MFDAIFIQIISVRLSCCATEKMFQDNNFVLLFFLLGFCLFFFSFVVDRYRSTLTSSQDTNRFFAVFFCCCSLVVGAVSVHRSLLGGLIYLIRFSFYFSSLTPLYGWRCKAARGRTQFTSNPLSPKSCANKISKKKNKKSEQKKFATPSDKLCVFK